MSPFLIHKSLSPLIPTDPSPTTQQFNLPNRNSYKNSFVGCRLLVTAFANADTTKINRFEKAIRHKKKHNWSSLLDVLGFEKTQYMYERKCHLNRDVTKDWTTFFLGRAQQPTRKDPVRGLCLLFKQQLGCHHTSKDRACFSKDTIDLIDRFCWPSL